MKASHQQQEGTHKAHNPGDLRGPVIEDVDHSLIIRVKKNMLPGPFVAQNVGCDHNRKELLAGKVLIDSPGVPDAIKPFVPEVSTETNCTCYIKSNLYIWGRRQAREEPETDTIPGSQELMPPTTVQFEFAVQNMGLSAL